MLYVQLDTNWPDHHKIIDAGIDGAGAHAILLCLAKRLEADGWVRRSVLRRYGIDADLVDRLADLALIDAEDQRVRPAGWLDRNPSQAAIDARRASKIEAGKRGNHAKWQHPYSYETCPKCHPEAQVVAGCDPVGLAEHRTPTKSKSEVASAITLCDSTADLIGPIPEATRTYALDAIAKLKANPFGKSA